MACASQAETNDAVAALGKVPIGIFWREGLMGPLGTLTPRSHDSGNGTKYTGLSRWQGVRGPSHAAVWARRAKVSFVLTGFQITLSTEF